MIVRFNKNQLLENQNNTIGVEGDAATATGKLTEAEKIVSATKQKIAEGATPAVGVSASNSGRGHDPVAVAEDSHSSLTTFAPTVIDGSVEEEPSTTGDSPEADIDTSVTKMDVESPSEK
jgi:protein phosphatase PTC1